MSIPTLGELYAHMEWADATVWRAAAALDSAPPDPSLHKWLLHIHTVQRAFLLIWTGQPVTFPAAETLPTLGSIRQWARPYYPEARAWIGSVSDAKLSEPLVLPWAKALTERYGRAPAAATVGETCFQVTSHS